MLVVGVPSRYRRVHKTTVLAPISIRLSRPNPASATDDARLALIASTNTPTIFQPNVMRSSITPLRYNLAVSDKSAGWFTPSSCQPHVRVYNVPSSTAQGPTALNNDAQLAYMAPVLEGQTHSLGTSPAWICSGTVVPHSTLDCPSWVTQYCT